MVQKNLSQRYLIIEYNIDIDNKQLSVLQDFLQKKYIISLST